MKATIKNFMGCAEAEIEADKLALLLGLNGQGKTSSLLPIAAALRGGVPLGLQKTKAGMLVKTGAGAASVVLENETSKVEVTWPKCERRGEGSDAPEASDIAVGAVKFPLIADKEKIELLRSILKCEPTEQNLSEALAEAGLSDKVQKIVWHNIEVEGWDATLQRAKEKGRSLKAQWAIIAGEAYGEKKAATWFPAGWENDLEGSSADSLEAEVSTTRAELEFRIANQAVGEDELLRLKDKAETLPNCEQKSVEKAEALKLKTIALNEAKAIHGTLPELPKFDLVCPHCSKPVIFQFGKLEAVSQTLTNEQREELEQRILDADNAISKAQRELAAAKEDLQKAVLDESDARNALAEYNKKKDKNISNEKVEEARNAVRKAESRLTAYNRYTEALRVHNSIVENQLIVNVLEPEGIRRGALEKGLGEFNGHLECLCNLAGWPDVHIDGDMSVNFGGRPYVLCSESEKFRASVTLQTAIADYDGSAAVVIDAADILDNKGRSGLLKMLAKASFCSFIGMTASKPEIVPNLKKLGIGRKYWIEAGKCEEVYNG